MTARVIVSPVEPNEAAREIDFDSRLTIGRASTNDVVIDQLDCSRNHAEVHLRSDGRYELIDLGSRNGCFVNGHRITGSRELAHGDRIEIAEVTLRFFIPRATTAPKPDEQKPSDPAELSEDSEPPTDDASKRKGVTPGRPGAGTPKEQLPAVVLASDVVGYRRMLDELSPTPFRRFAAEWFEECARAITAQKGALDRMASGSVLAYWLIDHPDRPAGEIALALRAAAEIASLAEEFAACFFDRFGGGEFRIGVGVHVGSVELGNAGATQEQVWTLLGEAVSVAVGLEALAEERARPVVVSDAVAERAPAGHVFRELDAAVVKQSERVVQAFALELSSLPA